MLLEPLPGLGVVGDAPVDGEVLVDGDALVDGPTSGETVGAGEVAACTAIVPKPPARPTPAATTILPIGPRSQPRLFMAAHLPGGNAMADRHPVEHAKARLSDS